MDTPDLERLTILERAQLLHDATLRRHGDIVDRHEERLARLEMLLETQAQILLTVTEVSLRLATTLQAIKDLLDRGNGHEERGIDPQTLSLVLSAVAIGLSLVAIVMAMMARR